MVNGKVALLEYRSKLELVRSNLVVSCLYRDSELQCLDFKILHEGSNSCRDCTEVVVLKLLVL